MSLEYAQEKFSAAVEAMATSAQSIQDRLLSAYLTFHPVTEDDFPTEEMKQLYRSIVDRLSTVPDARRGSAQATLAQMSETDALSLAQDIYRLLGSIEWHLAEGQR